jgi:hypothetical protein
MPPLIVSIICLLGNYWPHYVAIAVSGSQSTKVYGISDHNLPLKKSSKYVDTMRGLWYKHCSLRGADRPGGELAGKSFEAAKK